MVGGDVMLGRRIAPRVRERPDSVFRGVKSAFDRADIVMVNLECTISTRGTPWPKRFNFRAPPVAARVLHDAGIDVVSQANNHAVDYGWKAFGDAQSLLSAQGIHVIGAGADADLAHFPVVIERNGLRVAFLAYLGVFSGTLGWSGYDWEATDDHAGLAMARLKEINHDVKRAKLLADVVVVYYHAGVEMDPNPTQLERNIARVAFKSGASLVVGAHPHVLQTTSRQGHTLVAYSMGNFVFDMNGPGQTDSAILDVRLSADGVDSARAIPVMVRDGVPVRAHGADAARIHARLGL
jgi:poly-gamma-glutamate capsule biosynthesis protein CapA/YwtB (metallophosphatase superfamily)